MYFFDQPSVLIGVSEIREKLDKILKIAKNFKIMLGKRQEPVAVLVPIDQYQKMEELLDRVEDAVLGYQAKERLSQGKISEYISLGVVEKKVGLKK